jgi:transketolase
LYFAVLEIDPDNPHKKNRDRLILSKGHASVSLYTCLSLIGFFDPKILESFGENLSLLNGHPNKNKVPGVEANTGPLGHGLPIATGIALGNKFQNIRNKVFVITGDGELQEGSNWEAIMFASHKKLNNLNLIIDCNKLQQGSETKEINNSGNFSDKLKSFNWDVFETNGHNKEALFEVFTKESDRPKAIIANTIKGYGVSFMENNKIWHHKVPNHEQYLAAKSEIEKS